MYITYETHETRWVLVFSQKKENNIVLTPSFAMKVKRFYFYYH